MTRCGVGARDLDVDDRDPAEAPGRCRDVGGHRDRRHHLLEDDPLLGHVAAEIERRVSQQLVKGVALLLAHGRLFRFADQGFGSPSSSSVRYFGASAIALAMNAAVAASSSAGGASVRCATGTPTSLKNSSWPAGEQRHSSRAGRSETFRKTCGALAGTLIVSPARRDRADAAERELDLAVKDGEHLLEVVAVGRRPAARRDVHVDQRVAPRGVGAGHKDGVGVADHAEVRQRFIGVGAHVRQDPPGVVGGDRSWRL